MGIIETIKHWLGIATIYDFTTSRAAFSAFLEAFMACDRDENKHINLKELLSLYKEFTIKAVTIREKSDDEITAYVETILKRM